MVSFKNNSKYIYSLKMLSIGVLSIKAQISVHVLWFNEFANEWTMCFYTVFSMLWSCFHLVYTLFFGIYKFVIEVFYSLH